MIAYSRVFADAMVVADKLAGEGVKVEVIDLRTISPWDQETVLSSVAKTGRAVIVHEAVRKFGVGAEIAATIQEKVFAQLKAPVLRVGARYSAVPFSKALETAFMLGQGHVETAVRKVLSI